QVAVNPPGPERSFTPAAPYQSERVQRGGSFLCSDDFCWRYRPSARQGSSPDTGMSHVGFRCVLTPKAGQSSASTADGATANELCPCFELDDTNGNVVNKTELPKAKHG